MAQACNNFPDTSSVLLVSSLRRAVPRTYAHLSRRLRYSRLSAPLFARMCRTTPRIPAHSVSAENPRWRATAARYYCRGSCNQATNSIRRANQSGRRVPAIPSLPLRLMKSGKSRGPLARSPHFANSPHFSET